MYARGFDFGWFKNVSHSLTKWRYQFLTTYSILQHSRYISTRYTKVFLLFFTLTYIWQRDYWSSMFILSWKRSCESINFEITLKKKMNGRRRKRNKTTMNITGDKNQTTSSMNKPTSKKLQTPFFYLSGLYNSCISKRQCFFSPGRHTAHCIKCEYSVKYYQRRTQRTRSRGGGREEDTRDWVRRLLCMFQGGGGGGRSDGRAFDKYTDYLHSRMP